MYDGRFKLKIKNTCNYTGCGLENMMMMMMTAVFLFFVFSHLFIFGCVGSSLLRGLSLVVESGGYSLLRCTGFSLRWLLLLWSTGSRHVGFSSCGMRAQ